MLKYESVILTISSYKNAEKRKKYLKLQKKQMSVDFRLKTIIIFVKQRRTFSINNKK